ncbi:HD-GYP domain-containing protein [Bacillus testis]|uniref:HD-GYP domain-containing protein n=1 Tax=Bacillus testis TaxID=1622072 RepID=UPI00067F5170|nr:HD domain-containing phosphohydrolase [Bacillus testis]
MPLNEKEQNTDPFNELTPFTMDEIEDLLEQLEDSELNGKEQINEEISTIDSVKLTYISKMVDDASSQIEEIFKTVKQTNALPLDEIKSEIIPVIEEVTEIPHVYHLFKELHSKDEYTHRHNICVGVISGMIGKWLGIEGQELQDLELAGLLHDIGKTKIPESILLKPGKLTEQEYLEMKRHTVYGYQLIKKVPEINESIALAALQHHEREDGTGFPFHLKGHQIHRFAKITAVADVFHALSSERVYKPAFPFYQVISDMNNGVYGEFDRTVLYVFIRHMMATLVGKRVELSNGNKGRIVLNDPYDPMYSLVQIGEREWVDLQVMKDISISKVHP